MSKSKADLHIDQLAATFIALGGDAKTIKKLAAHTQKPKFTKGKNGRRKMPKTDSNINKNFKIKRLDYSVIATINNGTDDHLYRATITSVSEGVSPFEIGETFPISKRELELTGMPTSSK